jgi:hypothetical protein
VLYFIPDSSFSLAPSSRGKGLSVVEMGAYSPFPPLMRNFPPGSSVGYNPAEPVFLSKFNLTFGNIHDMMQKEGSKSYEDPFRR